MGRWEPDARGRLGEAAMALYVERGYEQVTVADIADRAGLTARTFFRYFTDKREVLFAGSETITVRLLETLASAPASASPLDAVATALDAVAQMIGSDHEHSRERSGVIAANADLQERERSKMAAWADELAEGLRRRGVQEPAASLAAKTGVAVFQVAFEHWTAGASDVSLSQVLHWSFGQFLAIGTEKIG